MPESIEEEKAIDNQDDSNNNSEAFLEEQYGPIKEDTPFLYGLIMKKNEYFMK